MTDPIIPSLLDLDFYKLTMGQFVWARRPAVPVTYRFINRTSSVRLAEIIPESQLCAELDHVRTLRFAEDELAYLRSLGTFSDDYLGFLRHLRLPHYALSVEDGQYRIETSGPWAKTIYWETIILSIVNELYYKSLLKTRGVADARDPKSGTRRLQEKIAALKTRPGIRFTDFGTRRRYGRLWQLYVDGVLAHAFKGTGQFLGTSDVLNAMLLDVSPIGTFAHELYMVYAGMYGETDDGLRASHNRVLRDWWDEYGEPLSIALTDTFGTDFFFRDFTPEQAGTWRSLRQDSGDPFAFGEKAIAFYRSLGIDPMKKTVVFSDGLDLAAILALDERFAGRIGAVFGWGTTLTNDVGLGTLSLVVKATAASGRPLVKLSDNPAKALGPPAEVERYKRVFGHADGSFTECIV